MNGMADFISGPMAAQIAQTILHSIWGAAVVAVLLAFLLKAIPTKRSGLRYWICCGALVVVVVLAIVTFAMLRSPDVASSRIAEGSVNSAFAGPAPVAINGPAENLTLPALATPKPMEIPFRAIVVAWALGVVFYATWHIAGWMWLCRVRHVDSANAKWEATIGRLRDRLQVVRSVTVIESARVMTPWVVGVLRPVILVPIGLATSLSPGHLEVILAHELAHIRRHDYLVNFMQAAVETLMFYHPAVWWISRQIRQERECCCDALAAEICGDPQAYVEALLALERTRDQRPALALAAGGGDLVRRVRRVLNLPAPRRVQRVRSVAAAVVALACVLGPLVLAQQPGEQIERITRSVATTQASGPVGLAPKDLSPITPDDLKVYTEHRIAPRDVLSISIKSLVGPNVESLKEARVADDGTISAPLLGLVNVAGKTEAQAGAVILRAYHNKIDRGKHVSNVTVTVTQAQAPTFTVLGPVKHPGQYQIPKPDFRLLDALELSGGKSTTLPGLYVIRKTADGAKPRVIEIPTEKLLSGNASVNLVVRPGDTLIVPQKNGADSGSPATTTSSALPTNRQHPEVAVTIVGKNQIQIEGSPATYANLDKKLAAIPESERKQTILAVTIGASDMPVGDYFETGFALEKRVKEYGLAYLSIVGITPSTSPTKPLVGEYYVAGYVPRTGVYSLTGRQINLKQAIAAAGGVPTGHEAEYTVTLLRRTGPHEEFIVSGVSVADLFNETIADPFLRPGDLETISSL